MTKIKNTDIYVLQNPITDNDFWIGTDGNSTAKTTKNFLASDVRSYFTEGLSPEIGGTLKYTSIVYDGGVYTTPEAVANNLNPIYNVLPYNVVIFSVNGDKYILNKQNITIGLLQTALTSADFIGLTGFTKLGDGTNVLKGYNATTGKQEFYGIKSTGLTVVISGNDLTLEKKAGTKLSDEVNVYKGLNGTSKLDEFYGIVSDTLLITQETTNIRIETPATASIPSLYVNSQYVPTYNDWLKANIADNSGTPIIGYQYKGEGTFVRPYTNTIVYVLGSPLTSPTITDNSSIQNGLDAYQSDGTLIDIQYNPDGYIFAGNFNYSKANLKLESTVTCTNTDWLIDMDSAPFDALNDTVNIEISQDSLLVSRGKGIKNSGNDESGSTFSTGKICYLKGDGYLYSDYDGANNLTQWIINSDPTNLGNNNDGQLTFDISCNIYALRQGVLKIGGKSRIDIYKYLVSGSQSNNVQTALKAFYFTGGRLRTFSGSRIFFYGYLSTIRDAAFWIAPTVDYLCEISLSNAEIIGKAVSTFVKATIYDLSFKGNNILASEYSTSFIFAKDGSISVYSATFNNNTFFNGALGQGTIVDITIGNTISSVNNIGGSVIETLITAPSRLAAGVLGLAKGSAFVNRKTVASTALVIGVEYQILTVGSTDWIAAGSSGNTVGLNFTAVASPSGTGTAYFWVRDILI